MGGIANYLENKILDHVLKVASYTPPSIYIALSTADPTEDGSGMAEPSGGGYARVLHAAWNASLSRGITNDGAVDFVEATGTWGTISHFAIFDALSGGNMLCYGALSASKLIENEDQLSFADEAISITWQSGGISDYLADEMLDHVFGTGAFSVPTNIYVALSTANPDDDASGIAEPSGGSYARLNFDTWNTASGGSSSNNGAISFVTATGAWGTISHFALFDSLSGGNMLFYSGLNTSKAITSGDTARFKDTALSITID